MAEPLSKLAEKCKSCPKSEKCDHKRMELCALADLPPQNLASATQSILIDNMSPVLREEIKASIQKMKKIAEIYEGEELELIDSYIEDNPPKDSKEAVWYLGESLKKLAQADVFIGIDDTWDWNRCYIETETANRYGIKAYVIPARYVIDDYNALVQKLHPAVHNVLL